MQINTGYIVKLEGAGIEGIPNFGIVKLLNPNIAELIGNQFPSLYGLGVYITSEPGKGLQREAKIRDLETQLPPDFPTTVQYNDRTNNVSVQFKITQLTSQEQGAFNSSYKRTR
jgi:hypothetical protein